MKTWFHLILILLWGISSPAKTLLVSDVDDTIKLANVQSFVEAAIYALDDASRFMGMGALYQAIAQDNSDLQVVYLSKAPTWLMQRRHQRLLEKGSFPEGVYVGRSKYNGEQHKIQTLRDLLNQEKPQRVILVGDNGEKDAEVYNQIAQEYRSEGIEFVQFIRIVYTRSIYSPGGAALFADQTGFVTPLEISWELEKKSLLKSQSVENLVQALVADLSNAQQIEKNGEYAFPHFVECGSFQWRWENELTRFPQVSSLKARIFERCGL